MDLAQALRFTGKRSASQKPPVVAFVGAGGKTTALFQLSRALLAGGYPSVFVTTTTHLGSWQAGLADRHVVIDKNFPARMDAGLNLITGKTLEDGRLAGLVDSELADLWKFAEKSHVPLLIEADGSRLKPLKAPADHEPVIPEFVHTVVLVAGLSGLGKPLSVAWVHRPERFGALAGLQQGEIVTLPALAKVLTHPMGGLKGIPPKARRVLLLNQADNAELQDRGKAVAQDCLGAYSSVIVASLHRNSSLVSLPVLNPGKDQSPLSLNPSPLISFVYEPNAILLLAAGASSRFGSPKQLIDWHGQPLVRHVAELALASGCGRVSVVVGAYQDQVCSALDGLPVRVIENREWQEGQAASVRAGIQGLPAETGSALFLLVDQPQVPVELLRRLFDLHAQTLAPLTAPLCMGRRANPVLFDRVTFPNLLKLRGDMGGRVLFASPEKFPVAWLPWEDERLLWDVDSAEDLQRLY